MMQNVASTAVHCNVISVLNTPEKFVLCYLCNFISLCDRQKHNASYLRLSTTDRQKLLLLPRQFYGPLSVTTQVSRYQKKHSLTHTYPDHQSSFISFIHLLQSIVSSLFNL